VPAPPPTPDPARPILVKGGTVITMDPRVGSFARGDVLVQDGTIRRVAAHVDAPDAFVIDASEAIVVPGFCDPHIHAWQGALGRLLPNNVTSAAENDGASDPDADPTRSYVRLARDVFGPLYTPEDVYIGTLATLLSALNGGITTVCDNMHNSRSPEHSDESIRALRDSGVRGIHAYGRPRSGARTDRFPDDAYRLRDEYFRSDDQLLSMRLYVLGRDPLTELRDCLRVRQDLDLWVSFDSGIHRQPLDLLYRSGALDGRETVNHGSHLSRNQRLLVRDHGSTVNLCPRIESQFRDGHVPYHEWVELGLRPGISNDDPLTYAIDMFSEMRALYGHARAEYHRAAGTGVGDVTLSDVLACATIAGAANCGLADRVGSLTPGKAADVVLIGTSGLQLFPVNNAVCSVVQGADVNSVRTVLVGGRVVKWDGQLVGVDIAALRRRLEASQMGLLERAGWPHDRVDFCD
jgi:5-methylthioadenosine/S-adenosylhomocysteine deaminase